MVNTGTIKNGPVCFFQGCEGCAAQNESIPQQSFEDRDGAVGYPKILMELELDLPALIGETSGQAVRITS